MIGRKRYVLDDRDVRIRPRASRSEIRKLIDQRLKALEKSRTPPSPSESTRPKPSLPSRAFQALGVGLLLWMGLGAVAGSAAAFLGPLWLLSWVLGTSFGHVLGIAFIAALLLACCAVVVSVYTTRHVADRGPLAHNLCPTCGYSIAGLKPASDGRTVCPECAAAWTMPVTDPGFRCADCAEPAQDWFEGTVYVCHVCGAVHDVVLVKRPEPPESSASDSFAATSAHTNL